jgi:hypothetical protein
VIIPSPLVFFLRDSKDVWWLVLTITAFLSCILFCSFYDQSLDYWKRNIKVSLRIFKIVFIFQNWLTMFISIFIFIPMLIIEIRELEIGAILGSLAIIIVSLKAFRIVVLKNIKKNTNSR